jgi:hypothetical protein
MAIAEVTGGPPTAAAYPSLGQTPASTPAGVCVTQRSRLARFVAVPLGSVGGRSAGFTSGLL